MYPADITLRVTRLSMLELLALGNNVLAKLQGNTAFPDPPTPLPEMEHLLGRFRGLISLATKGSKQALSLRNDYAEQVRNVLTQQAYYVRSCSNRDPALLATSGFPLRKVPQPRGPLTAPERIKARMGHAPGSVVLRWAPQKGARLYEVMMVPQASGDAWQVAAVIGRASTVINGLTSDARYCFKVRPIGNNHTGPESAVVSSLAA